MENIELIKLEDLLSKRLKKESLEYHKRSPYLRDYGRVIHSSAFRRLQGKTQIYPGFHSVIRTRLTHTIEVSEISESLYYEYFNTGEFTYIDLTALRTVALIHDIGHPPFGHKGDRGLSEIMKINGEKFFFEGNAQNFRIINKNSTRLGEEGLNLTIRVILGIIKKYERDDKDMYFKDNIYLEDSEYAEKIGEILSIDNILDKKIRTIECAIMDRADEISYVTHDIDDAIQNSFFTTENVIDFICSYNTHEGELEKFKKDMLEIKKIDNPEKKRQVLIYKLIRLFIKNIKIDKVPTDSYINMELYLISGITFEFNKSIEKFRKKLYKNFIEDKFIYSQQVQIYEQKARESVKKVYDALFENNKLLPVKYRKIIENKDDKCKRRIIVDYISGMTDSYFSEFYNRLFTFQKNNITDEL